MPSFISIVVPAYDAEPFIGRCIESLLSLDYPADRLEIIVVDNASSDRTRAIISGYPVMALSEERPGAAAARNRGQIDEQGARTWPHRLRLGWDFRTESKRMHRFFRTVW